MENLSQHISNQPALVVLFLLSLFTLIFSLPYFLKQHQRYGSYFEFAPLSKKFVTAGSIILLVGLLLYGFTPYTVAASSEIAIVVGNTQNTPQPKITDDISEAIESTMLQHKGSDITELIESIKVVSAVKEPEVITLDSSELEFKEIGHNTSNAKRSAEANVKTLEKKIAQLNPKENGADYLEAIFKARDNIKEGSRIIVIGSGLSDSGDLNFSRSNILIDEQNRKQIISDIRNQYGSNYLRNYTVEFYGLGDTVAPQESLSTKQKEIVRNIYRDLIRALGGTAYTDTKTLTGESIKTEFVVGTTDTGCGNVGFVFDDNNLRFVSNQAQFADESSAKNTLVAIKNIWDKYSSNIQSISVDGYIAHYPGDDSLSQERADLVKAVMVEQGIPADKIVATGKGFGPHQDDVQNRIVKVTVSRNSDVCQN